MTYDQWVASISRTELSRLPPPPSVDLNNQAITSDKPFPVTPHPPGLSNVQADLIRFSRDVPGGAAAMVADVGKAAVRGLASQPLAQWSASPGINDVINYGIAIGMKEAAKTDDERLREAFRERLAPNFQDAARSLDTRSYSEAMGYRPPPGLFERVRRNLVEPEGARYKDLPDPPPLRPEAYEARTSGSRLAQVDIPPLPEFNPLYQLMNNLRSGGRQQQTPEDLDKAYRLQQLMYELERARVMNDQPNIARGSLLPQRPFNAS